MKKALLLLPILLLSSLSLSAAEQVDVNPYAKETKVDVSPYAGGQFSLFPFATYSITDVDRTNERVGGGIGLQYQVVNNIGIEVSAISEGIDEHSFSRSFNEAGAAFKGYLPIGKTGLAPYGFIGYVRGLDGSDESGAGENRMSAGAGIELRATKLFHAFLDGAWQHDFEQAGFARFRLGGGVRF